MRPVNRIKPKMPPQAYKTYHIARPVATHFRQATCKEAGCRAYQLGWQTTVDTAKKIGRVRANYIRIHSGRSFTYSQAGTLVTFTFPPGQRCFAEHRVPVGREPIFGLTGGDWRGNPRETRPVRFRGFRQFIDDFGEHQLRIKEQFKRG